MIVNIYTAVSRINKIACTIQIDNRNTNKLLFHTIHLKEHTIGCKQAIFPYTLDLKIIFFSISHYIMIYYIVLYSTLYIILYYIGTVL